jgi:sugar lactone lactonase YvrE
MKGFALRRAAYFLACLAISICAGNAAHADDLPIENDGRLIPIYQSDRVWNAVTIARDGRVFVGYPGADRPGVQIEELMPDGTRKPFPNQAWNEWKPGADPKDAFVRVNALRIGPDGALWVVDAGAPGIGTPVVAGAARVLRFDLRTNTLSRVYPLISVTKIKSYVDDIRFNGSTAYITDAGEPGLIVLNIYSGKSRRVLDGDPSTTDELPLLADGKVLKQEDGLGLRVHADQLEVSPNGRYLYFQPASGQMARIETRWLKNPRLSAAKLASYVERNWANTPTTGGTSIDAKGTIYASDTNHRSILTITPDGKISTLISDPRLIWSDAMWIDRNKYLWIPATQLNLTPGFTGGKNDVKYPVWIYKMKIDAGPAPNDHRW